LLKKYKKKLLIFTGSRADYGIMSQLIKKIEKKIEVLIFAGADHFEKNFGNTYKEILKDGLNISIKSNLDVLSHSDNLSYYCSKILKEYSSKIKNCNTDAALVLGDRYEAFIFSLSCFLNKIPIFHLHGGEITQGAFDDSLRHAISKFSNFHFVTNKVYKKRLVQLGENPNNIFMLGSLGDENFKAVKLLSKKEIFNKYKIPLDKKIILITLHPETISKLKFNAQIYSLLNGLKNKRNCFFIFTSTNSDPGSSIFRIAIKNFVKINKNSIIVESLGKFDYINLIKRVDLMLGNSSSGVLESPNTGIYSINIGNRQKGRVLEKNIVNCKFNSYLISKKIDKYIDRRIKIKKKYLPTSNLISKMILKKLKKKKIILTKKFYDIKFKY